MRDGDTTSSAFNSIQAIHEYKNKFLINSYSAMYTY